MFSSSSPSGDESNDGPAPATPEAPDSDNESSSDVNEVATTPQPSTPPLNDGEDVGDKSGDIVRAEADAPKNTTPSSEEVPTGDNIEEPAGGIAGGIVRLATDDIFGEYSSSSDSEDGERGEALKKSGAKSGSTGDVEMELEGEGDSAKHKKRRVNFDDDEEDEDERRDRDEVVEDEEEAEEGGGRKEEPPTVTNLHLTKHRCEFPPEGPLFVRLPNFLVVESKPFDAETYEEEVEDEDDAGKGRLKLKIENTIRWRYKRDEAGNVLDEKESNAKIVRWSDGTMSLHLGSEIFDIDQQKIPDHNHLFIKGAEALQAQAAFHSKLMFRPYSTDALTYRKIVSSAASRASRKQKMKVMEELNVVNPEQKKQELIQREEEKLRANARRLAQQRRVKERPRITGLSHRFLEEGYESEEDGEGAESSISKIRQRFGGQSESDESEESVEVEGEKKPGDARIVSDDEDDEEAEPDSAPPQQSTSKQETKKKRIVIDEDEEDAEGGEE